uniref:Importin beta-3 subunit n=1 Tax=Trepomonas sp. PC1 TaxID=1076344 RepID=A0A146K8B7_9EUKA|eukprot:JAP92035.1 hypothetical protein TPC1_16147 [Trepomonas sp. PC1]
MNLQDILLLNTDKNADQKQVFELLEQYKAQSADIIAELFELIYCNNENISYLASLQAKFLLKKFMGYQSEYLYDLSYTFLKSMNEMHQSSKKYLLPTISKIMAHLFFQGAFDQLPVIINQSIAENPVDMIQITAQLYLTNKNSQLNDALCRLLLNLLKHTQMLPLSLLPHIQDLPVDQQMLTHLANTQIFLCALSWEDFPDYFAENIMHILQYLLDLVQLETDSKQKLLIDENCLEAFFNLLSNHHEEIEDKISDLIDVLISQVDKNDFAAVKIIKELARYYESPELGQVMKQKDQQLVEKLIKHLQYSEDDFQLAESFDTLFVQAYCQEKDRNSKVCEAQQLMQSILSNSPAIIDQIKSYIQENYQTELFQCISLIRTVVIQQSSFMGLQLRSEQSAAEVQDFFNLLNNAYNNFSSFQQLQKGELLKFGFDFFQFLSEDQQKHFIQITQLFNEQFASSNKFASVVFCSLISQMLRQKELDLNYINQLIPSLAQINQMLNFENESACRALCVCIQKSGNISFFANVQQIILQLLKKQMQQGLVQFCNLCIEMYGNVDAEVQTEFCDQLFNMIPTLEVEFEESMVFILQLLAYFGRFINHFGLNEVLNACLTLQNYSLYPDLTKAMLLYVNQSLLQGKLVNQFVLTKLNLTESSQTSVSQDQQLIQLILELIQKQSTAASAYETLNLLLRQTEISQEIVIQIAQHNFKFRNQQINNKQLCKQSVLFYANVIDKFSAEFLHNSCQINIYDLLSDVIVIGCQGAFNIKDKKAFLCSQILKLVNQQTQKQVKRALGFLLRKVRGESFLKEFKEAQTVDVILLNGFEQEEEDDPKDLDQLCLVQLGETNWKV